MYGKNWKKIRDTVRTRTLTQIHTHAQKYFEKQAKGAPQDVSGRSQVEEAMQQDLEARGAPL